MPYDNSVMESFFGSFKREALYRYRFKTEKDFFEGVAIYIHFYNSKRPHSVLMNQTPDKFGSIDGISDVYRCQPPKALKPCEFRAVRKKKKAVKNVFDHRFDHLHDHNLITIGV